MKSPVLAVAPLVAAVAWTVALIVDPAGYSNASILLIGVGLLLMGVVSVVGVVVVGGRWARRLGVGVVASCALVALLRPIDVAWLVALGLTALAAAALYAPSVTSRVRKLPAAAGPPTRAVILPLLLLVVPFVLGVVDENASWPALLVGLTAPLVALAFARVLPGGLIAVRYLWPLLAIGLAFPMGVPAGVVSAVSGVGLAALAADSSVKVAFHPPREPGTAYPIPPELAPPEILDAAEIDERGRPR